MPFGLVGGTSQQVNGQKQDKRKDEKKGKEGKSCKRDSAWGKAAETMNKTADWTSRAAVVSGAAALLTSETGAGSVVFGLGAAGAATVSWVATGGAAFAQFMDRNYVGLESTLVSAIIGGVIVPRGLQTLDPLPRSLQSEARRDFAKWLSGAEGEAAAELTDEVLCP